jgi:thioredoxin reductase
MGRYDVAPRNVHVTHLARVTEGAYAATLDDGSRLTAHSVLLALGFGFFKHQPREIVAKLPPRSYSHTSDMVDFDFYRSKRVLIVGGRQSAYEWAALIREHGAEQIHLTHRHDEPRFVEPDWSWVQPMVRRSLADHGWWRRLPINQQIRIQDDFWATGRLTLEPWLDDRVHHANVQIHPRTTIASADEDGHGRYDVVLDDGSRLNVHRIILATGYLPDIRNITFLDRSTILDPLQVVDGFPVLDPEFQTNLAGLYVTGLAATRDFGPFFSVTVGCPVAAKIIGDAVVACPVGAL